MVTSGIVAPGVDQLAGVVEAFFDGAVVGRGEIVEHLPHHRPHTGSLGGAGHRIFEQIHVAEAGGSGKNHFGTAEQRAGMHLVRIQQGFGREDVLVEPGHQRQVVGQTPKQGHGGVGVAVDQAGHDDAAVGIDRLFCSHRSDFGCRTDRRNHLPADRHRPIVNDMAMGIHGQDDAVGDQAGRRWWS
jgi:hypothetical protein